MHVCCFSAICTSAKQLVRILQSYTNFLYISYMASLAVSITLWLCDNDPKKLLKATWNTQACSETMSGQNTNHVLLLYGHKLESLRSCHEVHEVVQGGQQKLPQRLQFEDFVGPGHCLDVVEMTDSWIQEDRKVLSGPRSEGPDLPYVVPIWIRIMQRCKTSMCLLFSCFCCLRFFYKTLFAYSMTLSTTELFQ